MALKEYRKKRDFEKTSEPKGKKSKSKSGRMFVVQKHDATRMHYDFRLEMNGVLLSWAIPKGPSFDPADKRLSVHVEDHPIDYGEFEGVIPEDEYGGGTVMLWDRGEWEPVGDAEKDYPQGKIKFRLRGEKLNGGWTLVKMGGTANEEGGDKNWLMIKERDEYARKDGELGSDDERSVKTGRTMDEIREDRDAVWTSGKAVKQMVSREKKVKRQKTQAGRTARAGAKRKPQIDPSALTRARKADQPEELRPQLATLVSEPPKGEVWGHEIKFDGYRMLAQVRGGKVRMISRNGLDWTHRFGAVAKAVEELNLNNAILDGEVVVVKSDGTTDFQALQNYIKKGKIAELTYYLFDLPYCEGYDLCRVPLSERKRLLREIIEGGVGPSHKIVRLSEHIAGKGDAVFEHACRYSLEGVVSKRLDSSYEQRRTKSWLKIKCSKRQEFVIGGFTPPSGTRKHFGALLVGYHDENGKLIYAGRVGTGFNQALLKSLHERMKTLEQKSPPFSNPPKGREARGVTWIKPELTGEVEFAEWTEEGILRHPSFQGLREDKPADDVTLETPESEPEMATSKPAVRPPLKNANEKNIAGVELTNPGRVLYPEMNLTKLQLARFYEQIGEWVLPYVTGRPLSIVRCPQGHHSKCFYQKHLTESMPEAVRGVPIREKEGKQDYLVIDDLKGVISLIQIGVLEMHPWGCRVDNIERPDVLTLDLDPGTGVDWARVIEGAIRLKQILEELDFQSFVKTSGGKGLHVVIPIGRRSDWDEAKAFTQAVSERIVERWPREYLVNMSKAKRKGKIFVDYFRNGRGATSVAAYSTRARAGAPVSTPISWEELPDLKSADQYGVENLIDRLGKLKSDPWADFYKVNQSITAAVKRELKLK